MTIVGWEIGGEDKCRCGETASLLVEFMGEPELRLMCSSCVPPNVKDKVLEFFENSFGGTQFLSGECG
jgi:hypothetical protein